MAKQPLEGFRILDLGGVWAGTFSTVLLADLGAEVLKQENQFVWQPNTRAVPGPRIPKAMTQAGAGWVTGLPNSDPGEHPWNYHPMFVSLYRNKRSFTLDIRRPEGKEILGRLAAMSDAVLENSAVGTMEKLGISYEWLREQREDIIFLRAPGYGLTGDYASARTMGAHLEGTMGHQILRGYEGSEPNSNSGIFAADYIAATQIALAIMMAIWHRENTGKGQFIEMAQAENAAAMFAQAYMNYGLNGQVEHAIGNRSIYATDGHAPSGVYPCASLGSSETGDDPEIAITVTNNTTWEALRTVMGDPEWAQAPEFGTAAGRAAAQNFLDEKLAEWTASFEDEDLFARLQAAGIAAAPVLEASRALEDPHVLARNLYVPQELQDDIGVYQYPRPIYDFPASEGGIRRPPVAFGQDNDYVYKDLLGISDEQYAQLEAEGHIATTFSETL